MLLTTKEQADTVVAIKKYVLVHVDWQPMGNRLKLGVRVSIEEIPSFLVGHNFDLELVGNRGTRNHGFSLLFNKMVLRRYDHGDYHSHPDGSRAERIHKHYWTPQDGDAWTYSPTDIDPLAPIDEQLVAFCQECNIELRGSYQPLLAGGSP